LAAVTQHGPSLQYAKGSLNQDADCLKAAGLWDKTVQDMVYSRLERATFSMKFSLSEQSTPYASEFALAMRRDPFLKHFKTYNPNAWEKESCDPNFTDIQHPCRGTLATCQIPESDNLTTGTNRPCDTSCWRFAFRFHLDESKSTNGFMIQVEETEGLGHGQKIETEMAKDVNLKIFRTYTNLDFVEDEDLDNGFKKLSKAVQEWYEKGCPNPDLLENVFIGGNPEMNTNYFVRPRYEPL